MVQRDTALLIKQLLIWNISFMSRKGKFVGFLLEHPMDPARFMAGDSEENVSWWRMGLWKEFKDLFQNDRIQLLWDIRLQNLLQTARTTWHYGTWME